jgi:hypothetical protein
MQSTTVADAQRLAACLRYTGGGGVSFAQADQEMNSIVGDVWQRTQLWHGGGNLQTGKGLLNLRVPKVLHILHFNYETRVL